MHAAESHNPLTTHNATQPDMRHCMTCMSHATWKCPCASDQRLKTLLWGVKNFTHYTSFHNNTCDRHIQLTPTIFFSISRCQFTFLRLQMTLLSRHRRRLWLHGYLYNKSRWLFETALVRLYPISGALPWNKKSKRLCVKPQRLLGVGFEFPRVYLTQYGCTGSKIFQHNIRVHQPQSLFLPLAVDVECSDFEVDSDGRHVVWQEGVVGETDEERALSHSGVADDEQLEHVLAIRRASQGHLESFPRVNTGAE